MSTDCLENIVQGVVEELKRIGLTDYSLEASAILLQKLHRAGFTGAYLLRVSVQAVNVEMGLLRFRAKYLTED